MITFLQIKPAEYIGFTLALCYTAVVYAYPLPEAVIKLSTPLTVYVFLATECPLSQNYTLTLNRLHQQYAANGVAIVGVFPSDEEPQVQDFVKKYQVQFRTIRDEGLKLTRYYHATVTPEAFLVDDSNQVLYAGKIDNWAISLGKKRLTVTEQYLEEAIRTSLKGQVVKTKYVEPIGCLIELPHHTEHHRK